MRRRRWLRVVRLVDSAPDFGERPARPDGRGDDGEDLWLGAWPWQKQIPCGDDKREKKRLWIAFCVSGMCTPLPPIENCIIFQTNDLLDIEKAKILETKDLFFKILIIKELVIV